MPSLEERYPNLNFRPPRKGRTLIIFKGKTKDAPLPKRGTASQKPKKT